MNCFSSGGSRAGCKHPCPHFHLLSTHRFNWTTATGEDCEVSPAFRLLRLHALAVEVKLEAGSRIHQAACLFGGHLQNRKSRLSSFFQRFFKVPIVRRKSELTHKRRGRGGRLRQSSGAAREPSYPANRLPSVQTSFAQPLMRVLAIANRSSPISLVITLRPAQRPYLQGFQGR